MTTLNVVGHHTPRVDGPAKVTGKTQYSADISVPGILWGAILRSPLAHAKIVKIDTSKAEKLPGVKAVITSENVGRLLIGRYLRDMPVLAFDKVRFIGERVAAVAATDKDTAEEALSLIEVEYQELPGVYDANAAITPGAPNVHDDPRGYPNSYTDAEQPDLPNVCAFGHWHHGDFEASMKEADEVIEHSFRVPAEHHGYIEPHAVVVSYDQSTGRAEIWPSNKSPYALRGQLATALEIAPDTLDVHSTSIGGDFGGKGTPMDSPVAFLLSKAAGAPVKLVMSYTEELMAANTRHGGVINVTLGVKKDGRICALKAEGVFNGGAYGAHKPLPNVNLHGADQVGSCYRVPAMDTTSTIAYTNMVSGGHMRAPGAPQFTFAVERTLDMAAQRLAIDPGEFRLINVLDNNDHPHSAAEGSTVRAKETLQKALEAGDWGSSKESRYIGRGIAMYERGAIGGNSSMKIGLASDGQITIHVPIPDPGQGGYTVVQQIAAEVLGVPASQINIVTAPPGMLPFDMGVGGSRTTYAVGKTAMDSAAALQARLKQVATTRLEVPEDQMSWEGATLVAGTQKITLAELGSWAQEIEGAPIEVDIVVELPVFPNSAMSFTAQVAEVEVDPETGKINLRRMVTAHDIGVIVNPVGHQGQIEGAFVMGMGYGLMAELPSEEGRITTLHLGDYKLPTQADLPELVTVLLRGEEGPVPFGGQSIAEASNVPAAAAIANAVSDAIGIQLDQLPVSAERVYQALQGNGK